MFNLTEQPINQALQIIFFQGKTLAESLTCHLFLDNGFRLIYTVETTGRPRFGWPGKDFQEGNFLLVRWHPSAVEAQASLEPQLQRGATRKQSRMFTFGISSLDSWTVAGPCVPTSRCAGHCANPRFTHHSTICRTARERSDHRRAAPAIFTRYASTR